MGLTVFETGYEVDGVYAEKFAVVAGLCAECIVLALCSAFAQRVAVRDVVDCLVDGHRIFIKMVWITVPATEVPVEWVVGINPLSHGGRGCVAVVEAAHELRVLAVLGAAD